MKTILRREAFLPFSALVIACGVAAAIACGQGTPSQFSTSADAAPVEAATDGGPLAGLTSIVVSPATATITAGDAPTTAAFTAQGNFADGSSRDVTSQVIWNASPSTVLNANGPVASPVGRVGGSATMSAFSGSITGSAQVNVVLKESVVATGAPADSATHFTGTPDPTFASAIVYPLSGVLVPPNLDAMDFQWTPPTTATATTVYDLHFTSPLIDLHVYTTCTQVAGPTQCSFTPDATTWASIVSTLKGVDPASLTILAAQTTSTQMGQSPAISVQFASSDVQGGLYYFNTRGSTEDGGVAPAGIYRYDFDQGNVGEFFTQQQCAGCHALSKDGTKMLAPICTNALGCGRPLQLAVVDVASGSFTTPPLPVGDSDTQAWTPDNKYYATTPSCGTYAAAAPYGCLTYSGGVIDLIDATSNTMVMKVPTGTGALYPSFSNDGTKITYARGSPYNGPLSLTAASLFTMTFMDGSPPTWGAETPLVTSAGENNYYPSFSPDDKWVIYASSKCDPGDTPDLCDTYDDPSARVYVVPATGGTPIELSTANMTPSTGAAPKLDDSWPKWSPFAGTYMGGNIFWITFSSVRDYGFRTPVPAGGAHVRQLWLVGFDISKAQAGKDPSFAPVWLPFQATTTSNHIGQWTEKVVGVK